MLMVLLIIFDYSYKREAGKKSVIPLNNLKANILQGQSEFYCRRGGDGEWRGESRIQHGKPHQK